MRREIVLVVVLLACLAGSAHAQVGKDMFSWRCRWSPDAPHHAATAKIECGNGQGSAVVVAVDESVEIDGGYWATVVTAYHVIFDGDAATQRGDVVIYYRDGSKSKPANFSIVAKDQRCDWCSMRVWCPKGQIWVPVSKDTPKAGETIEITGYGAGGALRHFYADVFTIPGGQVGMSIYADAMCIPGDSGGAVFNLRHEVIGVVSGGWKWLDVGLANNRKATWPMRCGPMYGLR